MQRKSSIHVLPVKANSELHNTRKETPGYVKDFGLKNESWIAESIAERKEQIVKLYEATTKQKMQSKATPIREAVVVLNEKHNLNDLHKLREKLKSQFGLGVFQMHIHRDEGASSVNWHAHLVIDWTDEKTGKSLKLGKKEMIDMQTIVADTLQMHRGALNSKAERIEHSEYRKLAEEAKKRQKQRINHIAYKKDQTDDLEELYSLRNEIDEIIEEIQQKNQHNQIGF